MKCDGCQKHILPESKRCIYCGRPIDLFKNDDEEIIILEE